MSRIVTTDSAVGAALDAVAAQAMFTVVQSATAAGTVDEENVGAEGIDQRTLDATFRLCKHMQEQDNDAVAGAPTTYTDGWTAGGGVGGDGQHALSHDSGLELDLGASGIILEDGDLLRVHWQISQTTFSAAGTWVYEGWVIQPEWDITDNTLSNYEAVDGNDRQGNPWTAPGHELDKCTGVSILPTCYISGGFGTYSFYSVRGVWNYKHSGASKTIYGIQLFIAGPFAINSPIGQTTERFVPVQTNRPDANIERGHVACQVLRA